jgi:hypothetical protein
MKRIAANEEMDYEQQALIFNTIDCMLKIGTFLDDLIVSKKEGSMPYFIHTLSFALGNADENFFNATGITLNSFLNMRKIETLCHATPDSKRLIDIGLKLCKDPSTFACVVRRKVGKPPLRFWELDSDYYGNMPAQVTLDDAAAYWESLIGTLYRAIARKIEGIENIYEREFLTEAIEHVLGSEDRSVWDAEDLGFVQSFVRWASDRNINNAVVLFEEDPGWKEKFDGFDDVIKERCNELKSDIQNTDIETTTGNAQLMIQYLRLFEERFK